MGSEKLTSFAFHRKNGRFCPKTRVNAAINANFTRKCQLIPKYTLERQFTMAKRNVVEITLPHKVTLKADKLTDRTIRTIKEGDYLPTSLMVRGVVCYFYTRVVKVDGNEISTRFGSENRPHSMHVGKGEKVDVYRPL